jgi:hypothetical protein
MIAAQSRAPQPHSQHFFLPGIARSSKQQQHKAIAISLTFRESSPRAILPGHFDPRVDHFLKRMSVVT